MGVNSFKKIICSSGNKLFLIRVNPILEGLCSPEKPTGSDKSCSPFVKMVKKHACVSVQLNKCATVREDIWKITLYWEIFTLPNFNGNVKILFQRNLS